MQQTTYVRVCGWVGGLYSTFGILK